MTRNTYCYGGARAGARPSEKRAPNETRPTRAPHRAPRLTCGFAFRAPSAPHPRPMTAPSPLYREGASSWWPAQATDQSHQ